MEVEQWDELMLSSVADDADLGLFFRKLNELVVEKS